MKHLARNGFPLSCLNLPGELHREKNTAPCNVTQVKNSKKRETEAGLGRVISRRALPAGEHCRQRTSCLLQAWVPAQVLNDSGRISTTASPWNLSLQSRLSWRRSFLTLGPHFPARIHRISFQVLYSWALNS